MRPENVYKRCQHPKIHHFWCPNSIKINSFPFFVWGKKIGEAPNLAYRVQCMSAFMLKALDFGTKKSILMNDGNIKWKGKKMERRLCFPFPLLIFYVLKYVRERKFPFNILHIFTCFTYFVQTLTYVCGGVCFVCRCDVSAYWSCQSVWFSTNLHFHHLFLASDWKSNWLSGEYISSQQTVSNSIMKL